MFKKITFCGITFLAFLITSVAYSQTPVQNKYWFSAGVGKSHLPSGMLAFGVEFANKPTLITGRYTLNTEILSPTQPGVKVSEAGLLYGLVVGKLRFSTGVSGVWGVNRGAYLYSDPDPLMYGSSYYEPIKYMTVGLPGEIRFITTWKKIGLGLTGFGNLNAKRSFAGLNVSVYFGRMK